MQNVRPGCRVDAEALARVFREYPWSGTRGGELGREAPRSLGKFVMIPRRCAPMHDPGGLRMLRFCMWQRTPAVSGSILVFSRVPCSAASPRYACAHGVAVTGARARDLDDHVWMVWPACQAEYKQGRCRGHMLVFETSQADRMITCRQLAVLCKGYRAPTNP